jgi:hypothetical protein
MIRRSQLQVECLEDRSVPSSVVLGAAPAFHGLAVAVTRFIPQEPFIPVEPFRPLAVAPVFALNYGTGSVTLPALHGLDNAFARLIPQEPFRVSPVFIGLADVPSVDRPPT